MLKRDRILIILIIICAFIFNLVYVGTITTRLENKLTSNTIDITKNRGRIFMNEIDITTTNSKLIKKYIELGREIMYNKNQVKRPDYLYLKSITVEISTIDRKNNRQSGGTGVVVKEDGYYTYILTNAHVAGDFLEEPEIYIHDNLGKLKSELIAYHDEVDLALIKVDRLLFGKQPVKGFAQAKPQDRVFLVGHNLGRLYTYGEGVFAGYQDDSSLIQIPTMFGNSGSGVINQNGELVSMIWGLNGVGMTYIHSHGLAVDYDDIIEFLRDNEIRR